MHAHDKHCIDVRQGDFRVTQHFESSYETVLVLSVEIGNVMNYSCNLFQIYFSSPWYYAPRKKFISLHSLQVWGFVASALHTHDCATWEETQNFFRHWQLCVVLISMSQSRYDGKLCTTFFHFKETSSGRNFGGFISPYDIDTRSILEYIIRFWDSRKIIIIIPVNNKDANDTFRFFSNPID